jgi:hypothetical protein
LSTKLIPAGSDPNSVNADVGEPVVVTLNDAAVPGDRPSELALVMAGAWLMVRVRFWVADPPALVAVNVSR